LLVASLLAPLSQTEELKKSRMTLAVVTNDILVKGLGLLGIETVERM